MTHQKIKENAKKFFDQRKLDKAIPHFTIINGILAGLFIGSLLLTILEINIYQKTFISFKILFSIWILTGLIITPFLKKILTIYFATPFLFLQLIYNVVTWGGLVVFSFMWTNYNFSDRAKIMTNEKIISTGHFARGGRGSHCEQPYIIINYKGQDKQLVYYCGTDVEYYKSVDLTISKGLFGFDIVIKSNLKTD